MALLIIFVLGLIVGSFLNVVIYRLPLDESVIKPGSHCTHCNKSINPWNNIPVVSFILLRGKCANCKKSISWRYPLVELLTAIAFVTTAHKFGVNLLLFVHDLPFVAALIAVTFIDLDHRIIPDELSLGLVGLGLLTGWATPGLGLIQSVSGAAVGFGLFFGFAWLYEKMSKRSGLGGGDIKLLAALGAFVGPVGVMNTVLMSSILGSIIGIIVGIRSQEKQLMMTAIPYGPFLVVGGLYSYWIGDLSWLPFMTMT
ncbi:MAG: prepilin peptidase [Xanthomonadaceae bacterium]|nr:prepilin peptidase [Xanthomonadaceae bacterium]